MSGFTEEEIAILLNLLRRKGLNDSAEFMEDFLNERKETDAGH